MKICFNCVLPDTFPGISFDGSGVCNECRRYTENKAKASKTRQKQKKKFIDLLGRLNHSDEFKQRSYDVIMAYSGGKDSSYTLKLLVRNFGLRVLALTFDHGFLSPHALKNAEKVTQVLDVVHKIISPEQRLLNRAFRRSIATNAYPLKALARASSICNTCMNLVKSTILKAALQMEIPLIAYGWSPGQAPVQASVMPLNVSMIRHTQEAIARYSENIICEGLDSYLLKGKDINLLNKKNTGVKMSTIYNIHPLAFLEYDEEMILGEIQDLGWEFPPDTDTNSTNCLLNGFANQVHQDRFGFHPYAFEIAGLVRQGYMTRDEGLKKLSTPPDPKIIEYVKQKLGLLD